MAIQSSPSKLIARLSMSASASATSWEQKNSASEYSSASQENKEHNLSVNPSVIITPTCDITSPVKSHQDSFDDSDGFFEAISQFHQVKSENRFFYGLI